MAQYDEKVHQRILNDINTVKMAENTYNKVLGNKNTSSNSTGDSAPLVEILDLLHIEDANIKSSDDMLMQFEEILHANDFTYNKVNLENEWWLAPSHLMLGICDDGSLIPLRPSRKYYRIQDEGNRKYRKITKSEAQQIKYAYIFYKTLPNEPLSLAKFYSFMYKSMYKGLSLYIAAAASVVTLLGMAMPYATKIIFSEIIPSGDKSALWPVVSLLLGIAIGSGIFYAVRSIVALRVKSYVEVTMQSSLAHRMMKLPLSFFKRHSTGEISNSLLSVRDSFSSLSDYVISLVLGALFNFGYLWQLAHYSHNSAVTWCVFAMFALQILMLVRAFIIGHSVKMHTTPARAYLDSLLFNIFKGIQKVKTNGAEARFYKIITDHHSKTELFSWENSMAGNTVYILSFISIGIVFWLVPSTGMSLSEYLAFICAFTAISYDLKMLISVTRTFASIIPVCRMSLSILQAVPEADSNSTLVRDISGAIDIYDLHFSYREDLPPIFDGLNIHIKAGEYVALVGHSGCGKTTLLRTLLGFEKPRSGSVFFDDYDISTLDRSSLRRRIGTCLQDGRLFAGDIMSNVTITKPLASEEEVWEALRMAAVDDDVRRMPGGLHHQLDANGTGISGGQRQRLLIARAILARPRILFLDEATSALDNISQHIVTENLKKMNCTRITIAHRLSTIRDCDRIIVLHQGKVAEEGTFDELIAKGGIFTEIAQRQQV